VYNCDGVAAELGLGLSLIAEAGSFALTGQSSTLTYGKIVIVERVIYVVLASGTLPTQLEDVANDWTPADEVAGSWTEEASVDPE
jgi:hypothetical protein